MSAPIITFLDQKENRTQLPRKGQQVTVHYDGYLRNGSRFDSSRERNDPFKFTLGERSVIACWDMSVLQIPVGRRAKVQCPSALAYGSRGVGPIPPNADLTFDIEVLRAD